MSDFIEALSEPFPPDLVRQRKGNFGQMLDYVEAATVISRLNEILGDRWSFTVKDWQIDPDEVTVRAELQVGNTVRQQFGGSRITRKADSGETVSLGDDLKAAASDALKKCAAAFGVGLYLYGGGKAESNGGNGRRRAPRPKSTNRNSRGSGRVTNGLIAELFTAAKQAGVPQAQVIRAALDSYGKPISQLTTKLAEELIGQFTVPEEGGK